MFWAGLHVVDRESNVDFILSRFSIHTPNDIRATVQPSLFISLHNCAQADATILYTVPLKI